MRITPLLKCGQGGIAAFTDIYGNDRPIACFPLGAETVFEFDLRSEVKTECGELVPIDFELLRSASAYYLAMDTDNNMQTAPHFIQITGISVRQDEKGRSLAVVEVPNTATEAIVQWLGDRKHGNLYAELAGLNASGVALWLWQFDLIVINRLFIGGDAPATVSGDPAYYTAAETVALINGSIQPIASGAVAEAIASGGMVTSSGVLPIVSAGGYVTSGGVQQIVSSGGFVTSGGVQEIVSSGGFLNANSAWTQSKTATFANHVKFAKNLDIASGGNIIASGGSMHVSRGVIKNDGQVVISGGKVVKNAIDLNGGFRFVTDLVGDDFSLVKGREGMGAWITVSGDNVTMNAQSGDNAMLSVRNDIIQLRADGEDGGYSAGLTITKDNVKVSCDGESDDVGEIEIDSRNAKITVAFDGMKAVAKLQPDQINIKLIADGDNVKTVDINAEGMFIDGERVLTDGGSEE